MVYFTKWTSVEERLESGLPTALKILGIKSFDDYKKLISLGLGQSRNCPSGTAWRKVVLERDGAKCILCGRTDHLHVHHIEKWSENILERFNVDNGTTLCQSCHAKFHPDIKNWLDPVSL